jgi:hypothetical protein
MKIKWPKKNITFDRSKKRPCSYPPNLVHILILLGFAKKLFQSCPASHGKFDLLFGRKIQRIRQIYKGKYFLILFKKFIFKHSFSQKPIIGYKCWGPDASLHPKIGKKCHIIANDAYDIELSFFNVDDVGV